MPVCAPAGLKAPKVLAGTAVPDWLNVVNRRAKARARTAETFLDADDHQLRSLARGVRQHHEDDRWFHQAPIFSELSLRFTVQIRDQLANDPGMRPSFLGHILVELLLDAELIEEAPHRLDIYYQAVESLDLDFLSGAVNQLTTRPVERLAEFVERFSRVRFLYDYLDDEKLLLRLNQVMKRVGLSPLPEELRALLPAARRDVRTHKRALLQPPEKQV